MFTYPVGLLNPNVGAPTEAPAFEERSNIVGQITSALDVNFTATVNTDDILVMLVFQFANAVFTEPDDWTEMISEQFNSITFATYYLRAVGTESGTQEVVSDTNTDFRGIMFRYSACKTSGTPYEDFTAPGGTNGSSATIPLITTTGPKRLAVAVLALAGLRDPGTPTDYTKDTSQGFSAGATSTSVAAFGQEIASAGDVDADSSNLVSAYDHFVHAFALIPES